MRSWLLRFVALLALWLGLALGLSGIAAAQNFPEKIGRVMDNANLFEAQSRGVLSIATQRLFYKTTDEIAVVTVKSTGGLDIDSYARALGQSWRLGSDGRNNGVLVLVADDAGKVAIHVGEDLRATLPDSVIAALLENRILPPMRAGNLSAGVISGVDSLALILTAAFEDRTRGQPAGLMNFADNPFDRMFGYFLLGLIALGISALAIVFGTQLGWLPEKRTGAWRILDAIVWLASSIRVSSSSGSSSGSSSSGYRGGGGTTGGGGSSGSW